MAPLTFAIIGCGSRGRTYARIARSLGHRITAAADPEAAARTAMAEIAGDPAPRFFDSGEALLQEARLAEVAIVSTQDSDHFHQTRLALIAGYDVLLEKPAATRAAEVEELVALAEELGRKIVLCFVLRYTPFYRAVKAFVDSGKLGEVISITAIEGVEPWHQAHSFVRGHWSRSAEATPMLVAKCSHDTDILAWLAGSACQSIASFAGNHFYRPERAPAGATARCTDGCPHCGTCPFDSHRYLSDQRRWLEMVLPGAATTSDGDILAWLHHSRWGRCAYRCDQDTPDHQVVALQFENGITATLTMTAFDLGRRLTIHGTRGVLQGALGADGREPWLEFRGHFGGACEAIQIVETATAAFRSHGGGDYGLIEALPGLLADPGRGAREYVEGHRIAFAAARTVPREAMPLE